MKRICFIISILAIALAGCKKNDDASGNNGNDTNVIVTKVANMLYEATYDTYSSEPVGSYEELAGDMACSSVRNGNYHGRNFDFFANSSSTFVVRTTATENRYATIGVARLANINDAYIDAGLTERQRQILPWAILDGMNEKGLVVNNNVVSKKDWGTHPHTGTNEGAPDLNILFTTRAILDNCATVQEALDYLEEHNITPLGSEKMNLHIMLSDPKETCVVEVIDNKLVVIPNQYIMTNYHLYYYYIPDNAMGVERYDILEEHYDEGGESMEGMWNLMKRVRYTNTYDADNEWYSEIASSYGIKYSDIPEHQTELYNKLTLIEAAWTIQKENIEQQCCLPQSTQFWDTVHNTIYDMENKKMWITVHENLLDKQIHTFDL